MPFELDVEKLQHVMFDRRIKRDGRAIDEAPGRNQNAVKEQGVPRRDQKVGVRNIGGDR